ncbi:conserved hypothetical protein [Leishmania mexicana MHOM/GT/2001/U1103]|uniref:BRCT domain-containing protein n=1 Tax=Leishmania mexicana (strain MHOM/GT/2001/U1103) TaxID=929439 RepID=E9AKZ3_LEIMU|nr:conserved hypothetical protein [Leishmania mexicana MHOM/GT/2001/U1103]CBZ23596.1 conserved hypothetical protein [Leishmania mexicana MHOM/GT/2001/U1103]
MRRCSRSPTVAGWCGEALYALRAGHTVQRDRIVASGQRTSLVYVTARPSQSTVMRTCNSGLLLDSSSSPPCCRCAQQTTHPLPPLHRASMSLTDIEEAETVELLSEDSCSTMSASSQDVGATTADTFLPMTANADEEQLRRCMLHECACIPELGPQPAWLEEIGAARNGPSASTAGMHWDAAHGDHLIVPVRWRVALTLPGIGSTPLHTTPWVPYAVPLAKIIASRATAAADTASTMTSTTSSGGGSSATLQPLGSVQLPLGRSVFLLAAQLSSPVPSAWDSGVAEERLVNVAASISRAQCTLHLHYAVAKTPQGPSSRRTRPVCRSFDVFAISPTTTLLGVALQPHQRYHIKRKQGTGKSTHTSEDQPCDADGVLTLRVGPNCHVDVALDGLPFEPHVSGSAGTRPSITINTYNGPHAHTTRSGQTQDSPAVYRTSACRSGVAREQPAAVMQLQRGSTTSLITGDSTAVLATLSDTSDHVALSETSDHDHDGLAVTRSQDVAAAPSQMPIAESRKRRRSTAARGRAAGAVAQRVDNADAMKGGDDDEAHATVSHSGATTPSEIVLFTTGMRLSDAEEQTLKELGALVNPHLRLARYARVLVAQRPLVRSVKLLTVLPYVQDVVHQSWLDVVLRTRTLDPPLEGFAYNERRIAGSIESENSFDLRETMRRAPTERQRLFAQQRFWVHKSATPQEPPMNDLKTVVTASGGVITRRILDADVLVLPKHKPTLVCWRGIAQEFGGTGRASASSASATPTLAQRKQAGVLFVVPDDIFKCVLQQRRLSASSITLPRQLLREAAATRGITGAASAGRRRSQPTRKTPSASKTQRSPRCKPCKRSQ